MTPGSVESIPLGAEVLARVTGSEVDRLTETLGRDVPRELEGTLLERDEEHVIIAAPAAYRVLGARTETLRQRIDVRHSEIVEFHEKRFNAAATVAVTGAGAAIVAAVVFVLLRGDGGGGSTRIPPGGPSDARLPTSWFPIFSIGFP